MRIQSTKFLKIAHFLSEARRIIFFLFDLINCVGLQNEIVFVVKDQSWTFEVQMLLCLALISKVVMAKESALVGRVDRLIYTWSNRWSKIFN